MAYINKNTQYQWSCPVCKKYFKTRRELRAHKKNLNHYLPRKSLKNISYEALYGIEKAAEIKKKISSAMHKTYSSYYSASEMNKNRIYKIKKTAAKYRSIGGLRHGSGRGKKGWYKGYFCDSSWELAWVIFQTDHNIKFSRNKESFNYTYLGKVKKFYPDFLLDNGTLVEIKGYQTKEYLAKLACFPKDRKLITLYKEDMKQYLDYAISKFGKDFIKVYEK